MSIQVLRDSLAHARKLGLRTATGVTPDELEMALAEVDKLKARLADAERMYELIASERTTTLIRELKNARDAATARASAAEADAAKLRAALEIYAKPENWQRYKRAEAEWLKSLLPPPQNGWWECPADDQGFKIKYRWRLPGGQKGTFVFRRLGKRQIQTLRKQPYDGQVWLIADRIFGELRAKGRGDIAARLSPRSLLNQVTGAGN